MDRWEDWDPADWRIVSLDAESEKAYRKMVNALNAFFDSLPGDAPGDNVTPPDWPRGIAAPALADLFACVRACEARWKPYDGRTGA